MDLLGEAVDVALLRTLVGGLAHVPSGGAAVVRDKGREHVDEQGVVGSGVRDRDARVDEAQLACVTARACA